MVNYWVKECPRHGVQAACGLDSSTRGEAMYFDLKRVKTICEELKSQIFIGRMAVKDILVKKGDYPSIEAVESDATSWAAFVPDELWGGDEPFSWFRAKISTPEAFDGRALVLEVKTALSGWDAINPQFILRVNGEIMQGMDVNHTECILSGCAKAGEVFRIDLHAYSGGSGKKTGLSLSIAMEDESVKKLYYDIQTALLVAEQLPVEAKMRMDLLAALNETINLLDLRKPYSDGYHRAMEKAQAFIDTVVYKGMCGPFEAIATSVGHTHIDVAWLWTLSQTRQKVCRSFATVLKLMDEYPEYVFMSSQPQLYQFLKEDHPDLYEKVKEKILEGRWEAEGAMWVEADCNLSSGESLIRQILHGKRFFMNEFGVDNRVLWLPDVFGYSALLPQIMKKSGIDYFMTTKINWSQFNKFPADTFLWAGIDGSEILSHLITTKEIGRSPEAYFTTYNGFLSPEAVIGAWRRYQDKGINQDVLISYGYGDGGGGPTREQLEYGRRMEKAIPGCPKVVQGTSLDYFHRLQTQVKDHKYLPKWVGELYLEYHRGTYTSMGRNKRYNRKSEFLYQDVEFLRILSVGVGQAYPQALIHKGWECILLNQFHDILPGSSIKEVYDESRIQYEQIKATGEELIGEALHGISSQMALEKTGVVVFNTLGFERDGIVSLCVPKGLDFPSLIDSRTGETIPCQTAAREYRFEEDACPAVRGCRFEDEACLADEGKTESILFHAGHLPSKGCNTYYPGESKPVAPTPASANTMVVTPQRLENQFFLIRLGADGTIAELFDKRCGRQVLKAGRKGNALQAFEDKPMAHDNWDIDIFYLEKMWDVNDVEKMEVMETGPVRGCLRIHRRFSESRIVQDIMIYHDIPRIDFDTRVDWKENQVLLKVQFPIDVNASKATCDLSYGNVERNAHWNTSWDVGRFEVCAHKWVDVSEGGYGVSLLNDCKYGHDIREGDMRLTLIKSGNHPNPEADREKHRFTYSLYPHEGGWKEAKTVKMSYDLNVPLFSVLEEGHAESDGEGHGGKYPANFSFMSVDSDNVLIEVVKKAEDSDDIIVRLYEFHNSRSLTTVTLFEKIGRVAECDLLENEIGTCAMENGSFTFEMKPYEIKTFKLCK